MLAPGFFRCTSVISALVPNGLHPSGALGNPLARMDRVCGTEYQEGVGGVPCNEHFLYSIGVCRTCQQTPICGDCVGRMCSSCRQEAAARAPEARLKYYEAMVRDRLELFVEKLTAIPQPSHRYLAYLLGAPGVAELDRHTRRWGGDSSLDAESVCRAYVDDSVRMLFGDCDEDWAELPEPSQLGRASVNSLLCEITQGAPQTFPIGYLKPGLFGYRLVETGRITAWDLGWNDVNYYSYSETGSGGGVQRRRHLLSSSFEAYWQSSTKDSPVLLGAWHEPNSLQWVAKALGIRPEAWRVP